MSNQSFGFLQCPNRDCRAGVLMVIDPDAVTRFMCFRCYWQFDFITEDANEGDEEADE